MKMPNRILTIGVALLFVAGLAGCSTFNKKDSGKQESAGQYIDDATITTKVKTAIFNDPNVKATEVKVETYKGIVQLSGFVNSSEAASRAVEIARSVEGVKSVRNNMTVK